MTTRSPSSSRSFPRSAPSALAITALTASLSLAVACGLTSATSGLFEPDSAVVDAEERGSAVCPSPDASTFRNGSACSAPDGTTCPVTECAGMFAVCDLGVWNFSALGPSVPACPLEAPPFGEFCSACWQNAGACYYGCESGKTPTRARCRTVGTLAKSPTWVLDHTPCELLDAGPDARDALAEPTDADIDGD